MRIRDHLELPASIGLDAFITRLNDSEAQVQRNLRLYVLSERVREGLGGLLRDVGERLTDGRDVGRFVYGSFGSGKSHLLTVLGRMLERDEQVYAVGDPGLRSLRAANPWLDARRTLVVKVNMMDKTGLASALYAAYNEALPAGVPRLEFTDEAAVFSLIERDAERMGGLQALLEQAGISSVANYERRRNGPLEGRLELAAELLTWRDHGTRVHRGEELWLPMREGLERMARHASEHGYQSIAWLIDELVIWIRQFDREKYIRQINDLSAMVDHDAPRVLPFFVALAVQTDVAETCPEDISEKGFREHLRFVSDRFSPWLVLEEQDLYEVAARRVLRRREDAPGLEAFESEIAHTLDNHRKLVHELSGGIQPELVKRLYPFHPALLRVLMDLTQALSRSRTAIAVLYGLLEKYPDLEVGDFVPVNALWEFLFSVDQVQSLRQNARSVLSQRMADTAAMYERLEGKIEALGEVKESGGRDSSGKEGGRQLHHLVQAVLLCQLSERPYFPDGRSLKERLTASTLLQLNMRSVKVVSERAGVSKVARLFRTLSGPAPQVEVDANPDPHIRIKIEQVDIERVLTRARGEVRHADRFAFMRRLLDAELGLGLGTGLSVNQTVLWRGTRRKVRLRLENVRQLSYAGQENEFDPGEADVLLLVDYPFDEDPSKGREADVDTVQRAKARRCQWTVAWLPEHLTEPEKEALNSAAAVELVRKDKREYLKDFSQQEAEEVARALEAYQISRRQELEEAIRARYFRAEKEGQGGQLHMLDSSLEQLSLDGLDRTKAVEWLSTRVLDVRYPQHPTFERKVGSGELATLTPSVIKALVSGQPVELRGVEMALARAIAVPLELVYAGESNITPRTDGRFLKPILEWTSSHERFRASELRSWLKADGRDGFGFTDEVVNFFLYLLLQAHGFAGYQGRKALEPESAERLPQDFELVKEGVVDAPTWDRARKMCKELLEIDRVGDLPSSPEQSRLLRSADTAMTECRPALTRFGQRLSEVSGWVYDVKSDLPRSQIVQGLLTWFQRFQSGGDNATRVKALAALTEDGAVKDFGRLRRHVAAELLALDQIDRERSQVEFVLQRGDEADRRAVATRLRQMLAELPSKSLLWEQVPGWARETDERFRALVNRKDLLPLEVWARALQAGQSVLGLPAPSESLSSSVQSYYAEKVRARAASLLDQVESLRRLLEEACRLVDLDVISSPRVDAAGALGRALQGVAKEQGEVERLQRLAGLAEGADLPALQAVRDALEEEQQALRELQARREKLEWIGTHRLQEGRLEVFTPIKQALSTPVTALHLKAVVAGWLQSIERLYKPSDSRKSGERKRVQRDEVESEARRLVQELLEGLEGERFLVHVVIERQE